MKINKQFKNLIPPLDEEELKQLESNLVNEGWRSNERIITWNGTIVDGHNRFNLCQKHNIKFQSEEKKFKDKNKVILWIIDNQLGRRNISSYAIGVLNLMKESILKPIAKLNKKGQGVSVINIDKINVQKEIAKQSKVSTGTIHKIKFIRDNADEETKKELLSGNKKLSINKVYTTLKRKEKVKEIKKELSNPKLKKNKKYEIIYADPPWKYNRNVGEGIAKEEYSVMDLDSIKEYLNEKKILPEDNSVLFLWVTFPMLKEGLEVMEYWGFKYKTCGFNWIKLNKNRKPFFGIGHYTKSNSELCLIGIKGKGLTILDDTISQIIMTQKDIHSKKPGEVRNLIVRLVGNRKRIELFARTKTKGWDSWGNEVK